MQDCSLSFPSFSFSTFLLEAQRPQCHQHRQQLFQMQDCSLSFPSFSFSTFSQPPARQKYLQSQFLRTPRSAFFSSWPPDRPQPLPPAPQGPLLRTAPPSASSSFWSQKQPRPPL